MKNEIDPRQDQNTASTNEPAQAASPENRRHLRVRTGVRAGAGMVCPTGEC